MSKSKNIITALGLVAGIGVAALPLTSYAATDTGTVLVNVKVGSAIAMTIDGVDAATGSSAHTDIVPNEVDLTTMKSSIKVTTNSPDGYVLSLKDSDTETALTNLSGEKINALAGEPVAGTASWAVKVGDDGNWVAMPSSEQDAIVVKSNPGTGVAITDEESIVTYGVATSRTQPVGTYTDTVIYTATVNE